MKKTIYDVILILFGSFIFSIGINYFTIPNMLSEGGVIGLTLIGHYVFGWSTGLLNFLLNTILFLLGYKFFDKRTIYYTLFSIVASSYFLHVTKDAGHVLTMDTLLASIFAGLLVGMGIGVIFRAGGTSGGTTVLARIAHQVLGWSIGKGILVMDVVVVAASIFIIGIEKAMYTLVVVWVGAKAIDFIVDGLDERIAVIIISNQPQKILHSITSSMSRGLTVLDGKGGYTGADKEVLYIVINKQELVQLQKTIKGIDENAYVTVHHVHEVMGRGYKAGKSKLLKNR
ncbi:YitT family protein [Bacillus tuaregi]|uniref:YitT family protein n=1 Tax=Bacillus tuaregi TaxID=1816695 RepID=UPI0008F91B80|nr:YitT family protein [Bacillus tuaregi]